MVDLAGLAGLIVFYLLILGLGSGVALAKTWGRKSGRDDVMVAGRDIGLVVGIFTMTATWVGGGFLNGTAEIVFRKGLLYNQTALGYATSLLVGAVFFAKPYRSRQYITMIDPFQEKYGMYVGGLMYLPALLGELFWSAAILNALGASVSVILGLDFALSLVLSAAIAVAYTFAGGLFAVAYTDVLQLLCIPLGLCLAIPFAWSAEGTHMERLGENGTARWLGEVHPEELGSYLDKFLLLICGGIPWQAYFQRVLSTRSVRDAQVLSFVGGLGCFLMSIPPAVIGVVAQNVDWDVHNASALLAANPSMVLPLTVAKCTPPAVTFVALGAISAAVMSSSDSSLLSAASMFAHNVYRGLLRPAASERETVWVLRAAVVGCGALACALGLSVQSVYTLFKLCGDFVYVVLFPQLLAVLFLPWANSYGALSGFGLGAALRALVGIPSLGLGGPLQAPASVPVKTMIMLANLLATLTVSALANVLFARRIVGRRMDFLKAFVWENSQWIGQRKIRLPVE